MKILVSYLGQLRIYSLIDLIMLLVAIKATPFELIGVILLHVGFLAYLESQHSHSYRKSVPKYLWITFVIPGMFLYGHFIFGILFIVCSFLYTLKNRNYFAIFSPLIRGLQYFFLVGGIVGFQGQLPWIALVVICARNLIGDIRDVIKDKEENMKTIPVVIGFKKGFKYLYPVAVLATTLIWWNFTALPLWILLSVFVVEVSTYNLTSR
ncbi:MAG: hypothetical protein V4439_01610 [Patescibacteria group bacterium]